MLLAALLLPLAQDNVLELDDPAARRPDDGSFARAVDARWASGRRCVVRFYGEGRASWTLDLDQAREGTLWLRYASSTDVTLPFGWGGLEAELEEQVLPSTGGTSGKYAWGWAALDTCTLQAGSHAFTLGAAPPTRACSAGLAHAPRDRECGRHPWSRWRSRRRSRRRRWPSARRRWSARRRRSRR